MDRFEVNPARYRWILRWTNLRQGRSNTPFRRALRGVGPKCFLVLLMLVAGSASLALGAWSIRFAVFETSVMRWFNNSPVGYCYIVSIDSSKRVRILEVFPVSCGENPGMKHWSGDKRTPHGLYYITRVDRRRDKYRYGGYFLLLDYPNDDDYRNGRGGGGIGIHGGRPRPTNGCLRILDDGWQFGDTNIRKFVQYMGYNSRVAIVRRLDSRLKGKRGDYLGHYAYRQYMRLLARPQRPRISRGEVLELLE